MSQLSPSRYTRWLLPAIILVYLILATLYAAFTPDWQAPDEPAHYNYIKYLAEQHRFPILKPGDYTAEYLEEIKAARFPAEMSIAPIRYEFHQPPLYYILAVPVYGLFGGSLLPLRLLSVAMGALLLLVICWTVQAMVPDRAFLALGATAFVAFLPMHLAMTAAVNNDTLAELLLATILLLSIRYLRLPGPALGQPEGRRLLILLGITTGLGLLTKSAVYVAVPLVLLAIALKHLWVEGASLWGSLKSGVLYAIPAFLLGLPWWLRNIAIYGGFDFLGLNRHDEVVVGQLRTSEFVAGRGFGTLLHDFALTTFHSFWGQFGWMGVLLDERIYQALAILSALALTGFLLWALDMWPKRATRLRWQWAGGCLLVVSGLLSLAAYLWYNAQFVQHQGRYLFTALVPIGLAVALGWRESLRHERSWLLVVILLMVAAALRLAGWLPNWPLLMVALTAVAVAVRWFLPRRLDPLVQACPYLLLIALDLVSLFFFVIPQLAA
jgi:4-amino-4-deoxy-L-arabinose transferase-like glycosyltransferase